MDFPTWITLENIYYISGGPLLLITAGISAIYAYLQISSAKKVFKIDSKRKSVALAAEKCNDFKDIILSLSAKLDIRDLEKCYKVENDNASLIIERIKDVDYSKAEIKRLEDNFSIANDLLNELEGFSIYFTEKIADEKTGFYCTSKAFCRIFEEIISTYGEGALGEKNDFLYSHTITLYVNWKNKRKKIKMEIKKENIEKELKQIKTIKLDSLGTEA